MVFINTETNLCFNSIVLCTVMLGEGFMSKSAHDYFRTSLLCHGISLQMNPVTYKLSEWKHELHQKSAMHIIFIISYDSSYYISQVYLSPCLRFEDVMSVVPESVPYYRVQFPRLSPSLLRAWSRILVFVSIYVVFHPFRCKE